MAFIVFIAVVAIIAAISVSIVKAIIFAIVVLVAIIAAPLILLMLIGLIISPVTIYLRKRAEKRVDYDPASYMASSAKYGTILSQSVQLIVYLLIALISYEYGEGYLWAALSGIAVKSIFDYIWGDLPFQKQKFATDEYGNTVSVKNSNRK